MKRNLTLMSKLATMTLVGQTEASNAEEQLVRDSRLNATNCRWDGGLLPSQFTIRKDNSELCNALKKPNKKSTAKGGFIICRRQEKSQNNKVDLSNSN
jgi:hypothetical protein